MIYLQMVLTFKQIKFMYTSLNEIFVFVRYIHAWISQNWADMTGPLSSISGLLKHLLTDIGLEVFSRYKKGINKYQFLTEF